MELSLNVGIDLGTTNSVLAVREGAGTHAVPDARGETLLPSAVHVDADGTLHVGAAAMERHLLSPADTAFEFKRLMGTGEPTIFPSSRRQFSPEELSAHVLRTLVSRLPEPVRAAVITVPAMFQLPQCDATQRAAKLAGIEHAPLLQEPIAAAMAHAGTARVRDGYWLVYDLGGGTFDATLVRCRAGQLLILDHDGDNQLGGKDLDRALARRAVEIVRADGRLGGFKRHEAARAADFARIRAESERVRVALSSEETATFRLDALGGLVDVAFDIDREEFEDIAEPALLRTVTICRGLLERNKVPVGKVHGVVLVGGPTRTPCVPSLVTKELGIEAKHVGDPMLMVARGAALFASTVRLPPHLVTRRDSGMQVGLTFDAMTTDLYPLVVGQIEGGTGAGLRAEVRRTDGGWASGPIDVNANGSFAVALELAPEGLNTFDLSLSRSGDPVPVSPSRFNVLHGLALGSPPLSESVGVALADNAVSWYLRKGAPLPARKTVVHSTTIPLAAGASGVAIEVPLVQGESSRADRNKVVGVLRIRAERLTRDVPAGAEVHVTLEVDEFSRTRASAWVPLVAQTFDEVVAFGMERKAATQVTTTLADQRKRMAELAELAETLDEGDDAPVDERVKEIETLIDEGDRDSVDLADKLLRKMSQDLDRAEAGGRAARIKEVFDERFEHASSVIKGMGDDAEKRQLAALKTEFDAALAASDLDRAERRSEAVDTLAYRVLARSPVYWQNVVKHFAAKLKATAPGKGTDLLARAARVGEERDIGRLIELARAIIALLPPAAVAGDALASQVVSHVR